MDMQANMLARRYAQAYFNVYGATLTEARYTIYKSFAGYLRTHTQAVKLLSLHHISYEAKCAACNRAIDSVDGDAAGDHVKKLCALLIAHDRIALFPLIVEHICALYRVKHGRQEFTLESSHVLTEQQIQCVTSFLERSTGSSVTVSHRINKNLIAGIRVYNASKLWEYSIRNQLSLVKRSVYT